MNLKNIYFNGKPLSPDMEGPADEVERRQRERLVNDLKGKFYLKKQVAPRYKEYFEKNGEVKILNQREKNFETYERELEKALKRRELKSACIIIIVACPEKIIFESSDMIKIIDDRLVKMGLKPLRNPIYKIRANLAAISRSEVSEFLRITPRTSSKPASYSVSEDFQDTLSTVEAIELSDRYNGRAMKTKIMKKESKEKENKTAIIKAETKIEKSNPPKEKKGGHETVIEVIRSYMDKEQNGLLIVGDITININVGK